MHKLKNKSPPAKCACFKIAKIFRCYKHLNLILLPLSKLKWAYCKARPTKRQAMCTIITLHIANKKVTKKPSN